MLHSRMLIPLMMTASVFLPIAASAQTVGALTTRVSVAADGTQANGDSGPAAAITADGRYVAFASAASNLVPGDTNGSIDVFVKDRQTGAIVRVSVASDGTERTGDSGVEGVDLTDDGNIVVFTSTIVESTNNQPVVVERALWWPSGNWYEAHLSAGATATGTKWGFAGETQLRSVNSDMYLLIANTSGHAGTATIKIIPSATANAGEFPDEISVPLPANSRVTLQTNTWFPPFGPNEFRGTFGGIIEADVPIVVEQANYVNSNGRVWELGSSALATKIQ